MVSASVWYWVIFCFLFCNWLIHSLVLSALRARRTLTSCLPFGHSALGCIYDYYGLRLDEQILIPSPHTCSRAAISQSCPRKSSLLYHAITHLPPPHTQRRVHPRFQPEMPQSGLRPTTRFCFKLELPDSTGNPLPADTSPTRLRTLVASAMKGLLNAAMWRIGMLRSLNYWPKNTWLVGKTCGKIWHPESAKGGLLSKQR